MATYTSSLPDELLEELDERAKSLKLPKNKLIENALRIYLDQLNRSAYLKSYRQMQGDESILKLAEEGMEVYMQQLAEE